MKELELIKTYEGYRIPGYFSFVDSFDVDVVASATTGDYQGDYHWLLHDPRNDEYAYLIIGYGSCSGCDWLEAADGQSKDEWYSDRDGLWNGLIWMTRAKMMEWLNDDSRQRDYTWHDDEPGFSAFLDEGRAALAGNGVGNCPSCMIPDCASCWGRGCEHGCYD